MKPGTPGGIGTNVVANMVGRAATILSNFIFLPFYLAFLGAEAYGVIAIYASVLGILAISDLGLTATMNREMARLSLEEDPDPIKDTVRTLESVYFAIAAALSVVVVLAAPLVAGDWVTVEQLSVGTVENAVRLMGAAAVFQLVSILYVGGMLGLERQVHLNVILTTMAALRGGGSVLVLWLIDPSLEAFFVWQVVVNIAQFMWLRMAVLGSLPASSRRPRFKRNVVRRIWRYSAGMMGMSITGAILLQTDKVILSRALSLETFGFYSIAWIVAQAPVNALSNPVYRAVFPRMTQYVETEARSSLRALYHLSCQVVSVLVLPVGIVITLFGHEVLMAWLGEGVAADAVYPLLVPLAVAMTITGMLVMPYALQLAHEWTSLAVSANTVAGVVFIPLVLGLVGKYGAVGGGIAWILLTSAQLAMVIGVMHRFILKGHARRWLTRDVMLPLAGAALPALVVRGFLPDLHGRVTLVAVLGGIWFLSSLGALAVTPGPRNWLLARYRRSRKRLA